MSRTEPFGTVYFGATLAVIGLALTIATTGAIGPVLAIVGTVLACTGLVLRALHRAVSRDPSDAGQV